MLMTATLRKTRCNVTMYKDTMYLISHGKIIAEAELYDENAVIAVLRLWHEVHGFRDSFIDVMDEVLDYMAECHLYGLTESSVQ